MSMSTAATAPPVSPPSGKPGSAPPSSASVRRPEKRQRNNKTDTRWDDAEYAALTQKAQAAALSRNGYIRASALGTPGPRARRAPHVNAVELAEATAALNKVGNLLNQIAHAVNTALLAGQPIVLPDGCAAAIEKTIEALDRILEITGHKDRQ